MKNLKLLSLAFFAIVAFTISSCNDDPGETYVVPFTITELDYDGEGSASDGEILATFEITNNTAEQLTLHWVRQNLDLPTGWETAICDHILCYDRALSEKDLVLDANKTEEIKFTFYPEGVAGTGTAELEIYDTVNRTESSQILSLSALARQ